MATVPFTGNLAIKGGTTAKNLLYTGPARTLSIDTDRNEIRIHNGTTAGGVVANSNLATTTANGWMSSTDKSKLDNIPSSAAALGNTAGAALGTAAAGVATTAAKSDHVHAMPTAAQVGAVATTAVGAANGVAGLDATGKLPSGLLPSGIGGGATGGGTDKVFYEDDQAITSDYVITAGKNAISTGPLTINTGKTVEIPTGTVWTIV
jgi:hypothetical protein